MCGISINRTTAVFFGMTRVFLQWADGSRQFDVDGYLKKLTFHIWNETGIQVDPYYHQLGFDDFTAESLDFDCTTYFTKAVEL